MLTCIKEYDGPRTTKRERNQSRWYTFYRNNTVIDSAQNWPDAQGIATTLGYEFRPRSLTLDPRWTAQHEINH